MANLFAVCCTTNQAETTVNKLLQESQEGVQRLADNARRSLIIIAGLSFQQLTATSPPTTSVEQSPFHGKNISEIPSMLESISENNPGARLSKRYFVVLDDQTAQDGATALLAESGSSGGISVTVRVAFNSVQQVLDACGIGSLSLGEISTTAESQGGVYNAEQSRPAQ